MIPAPDLSAVGGAVDSGATDLSANIPARKRCEQREVHTLFTTESAVNILTLRWVGLLIC